jgi:hypothetical protein
MGYQKSKNATMERTRKGFLRLLSGRKSVHFFGKKYCVKMYGKKSRKGLIA